VDIAEDITREHTRVIKANSFVDALRPVYDYMSMLKFAAGIDERAEGIAAVINEFWSALKEKMPEAFERANDYALFKSGGVGPMHIVLLYPGTAVRGTGTTAWIPGRRSGGTRRRAVSRDDGPLSPDDGLYLSARH
jgi:hypothetical protein